MKQRVLLGCRHRWHLVAVADNSLRWRSDWSRRRKLLHCDSVREGRGSHLTRDNRPHPHPQRTRTLKCCFNVGPTSWTISEHHTNMGWRYRLNWVNHSTLKALKYLNANHWDEKFFFQFVVIINFLLSSFWFSWITMLWVYGHYKYFYSYCAGIDFGPHNLTSSVCRRQILTSNVNPHALRVEPSWCIQASEEWLDFVKPRGFRTKFVLSCFKNNYIFVSFATHFKSSSSTTSRELRQQFAPCNGWRWQW